MIAGLMHGSNARNIHKIQALLDGMSQRASQSNKIISLNSTSLNEWRKKVADVNPTGVIIFDEKVPTATIHRNDSNLADAGISDNLMGNFNKRFEDIDKDGEFEIEDIPEEYSQDAWVCRLTPHSCAYSGGGWLRWWYYLKGCVDGIGLPRSYDYMLDYWKKKLDRNTVNPLSSFIATSDYSGMDEVNKKGFPLHFPSLRADNVFDKILNIGSEAYYVEETSPMGSSGMDKLWHINSLGTAWHAAHSGAVQLGDFRYDDAYKNLKLAKGPTLLITFACSVGEWSTSENHNIIANIFNSRECNNIKCIYSSWIVQMGAGALVHMNELGEWCHQGEGKCFFEFMKDHKGKPIGLAHRDWLNLSFKHYIAKDKLYPGEDHKAQILQNLCINAIGDATTLL